jgi:hypothetical protein
MPTVSWFPGHAARLLFAVSLALTATITPVVAQSTSPTSIQLPDGSVCQFNTAVPVPTANGQPATYTCGPAPNSATKVIMGTPVFQNGAWTVNTGVFVPNSSGGYDLQSPATLTVDFSSVRLTDGSTCTWVGSNPVSVGGQPLNYTCGSSDVGLLGNINTSAPPWTANRVRLAGSSNNFQITSQETVTLTQVVSQTHSTSPAPTPSPSPAPTAAPTPATSITMPDGSVCQFAGTGATAVFNGQRVNYTCGTTSNNGTNVILGTPAEQNGLWTVTTGIVDNISTSNPTLRSSGTVYMTLSTVTLVDNTVCTPVPAGTAIVVNGQPMNYTCGRSEEGLIGDFNTTNPLWTANRVVVQTGTTNVTQSHNDGIASVVGVTAPAPAQATSIQLPDGSLCQFSGTGTTVVFNGQKVTYNCGQAPDGSSIVLLGTPAFQNGSLVVMRGFVVQSSSGPSLKTSDTLTLNVTNVTLADGSACASTGQGAGITLNGQRLNYTCGTNQSAGLIGAFNTVNPLWTAVRVQLVGTMPNVTAGAQDTIGIATSVTQPAGGPAPTPQPSPQPQPTPGPAQPAPPQTRDGRYFTETNFRVANDAFWNFFQSQGEIATFGFPISRQFGFLGCQVQFFQRLIMQQCGDNAPVALLNLLDPGLFPYTVVNQSVFPGPDDTIKAQTPVPGSPNYDQAIIQFVNQVVPDTWMGEPVNYLQTFNTTGGLQIWGAPISNPAYDPGNHQFIYQRFQRGIMHYTVGQGTRGILLADYFKAIILGPTLAAQKGASLPDDLNQEAKGSANYSQYCPGAPLWVCRPQDLPGSDLTFAFEAG